MKKLVKLKDFEKQNEQKKLDLNEYNFLKGGKVDALATQGTWRSENFGTNEDSGFGHSWDIENWHYGDGENDGQVKATITYFSPETGLPMNGSLGL